MTTAAFNPNVPNSARVWNYWLGGKDNFAADRAVGAQVESMFPQIAQVARSQRAFLRRVLEFLAGEAGVRQFLDIGAGLPAAENTHQVVFRVAPDSRVVYADNDPVVLSHASALLTDVAGRCAYLDGDIRDPGELLEGVSRELDLTRPAALILLGILGHVADDGEARSIVARLTGALVAGSYVVLADGVDTDPAGVIAQERYNERSPAPYHLRSPERLGALLGGLELVEPGLVRCSAWRPHDLTRRDDAPVYGGVARKA